MTASRRDTIPIVAVFTGLPRRDCPLGFHRRHQMDQRRTTVTRAEKGVASCDA